MLLHCDWKPYPKQQHNTKRKEYDKINSPETQQAQQQKKIQVNLYVYLLYRENDLVITPRKLQK